MRVRGITSIQTNSCTAYLWGPCLMSAWRLSPNPRPEHCPDRAHDLPQKEHTPCCAGLTRQRPALLSRLQLLFRGGIMYQATAWSMAGQLSSSPDRLQNTQTGKAASG